MSTRMNELGNPFTTCLLNDLRLPFQGVLQVPLFTCHSTLHAANTSSIHGLHVDLTPCFQLFRRAGTNVANLSQIAQRGCSVRSHGVVERHLGMRGWGMRESFVGAISCFAVSLARLAFRIAPASLSSCMPRRVRGRQQNTHPLLLVASATSCNAVMCRPCRMPRCYFP